MTESHRGRAMGFSRRGNLHFVAKTLLAPKDSFGSRPSKRADFGATPGMNNVNYRRGTSEEA